MNNSNTINAKFNKLLNTFINMAREREFNLLFGRMYISKWEKAEFEPL
ncbi:MAG: hypothetical protein ACP5M9_03035 [Candidatus Micrarchaeia archaeon]